MNNKLKRSYDCMDLPYSATIEDVETRKRAMIKIVNSNYDQETKSKQKEIALIEKSAKAICDEINANGIPDCDDKIVESSDSMLWLVIGVAVSAIICFFSFL